MWLFVSPWPCDGLVHSKPYLNIKVAGIGSSNHVNSDNSIKWVYKLDGWINECVHDITNAHYILERLFWVLFLFCRQFSVVWIQCCSGICLRVFIYATPAVIFITSHGGVLMFILGGRWKGRQFWEFRFDLIDTYAPLFPSKIISFERGRSGNGSSWILSRSNYKRGGTAYIFGVKVLVNLNKLLPSQKIVHKNLNSSWYVIIECGRWRMKVSG